LAKAEDLAHLCPSAKADGNLCSFCAKPVSGEKQVIFIQRPMIKLKKST
jgi:hypothetical protein